MTDPITVNAAVTGTITVAEPAPTGTPDPSGLTDEDKAALKDARAADIASLAALHSSLLTLAAGSVERSRAGATAIVTAAGAIATVYAGLLALVYSADGAALPTRGLLSPIFFALSIALATAYLAYITAERSSLGVDETGGWGAKAYKRVAFFIRYTRGIVARRVWMLQAAVVALALGVIGIALPFVAPEAPETASTSSGIEWPPPPPASGNADLDAILYQAQIDEAVAAAGARPPAETWIDEPPFFWSLFGGGIALVVLIPLATWAFGRKAED